MCCQMGNIKIYVIVNMNRNGFMNKIDNPGNLFLIKKVNYTPLPFLENSYKTRL